MELSSIEGKVFQLSPEEEYGPIRPVQGGLPEELKDRNVKQIRQSLEEKNLRIVTLISTDKIF
jgi:hypothetical protein